MEPDVRKLRQGWSVSDDSLLVVAATREQALARFQSLKASERSSVDRTPCSVEGCGRLAVGVFNVVWLCAEHSAAALAELRVRSERT